MIGKYQPAGVGMVPCTTELGRFVRERRLALDLRQVPIGKQVGIRPQHISHIEVGSKKYLTQSQIDELSRALQCDPEEIRKRTPLKRIETAGTELGRFIRERRKELEMSLEAFASKVGISLFKAKRLEAYKETISPKLVKLVAKALDLRLSVFIRFLPKDSAKRRSEFGRLICDHRKLKGMSLQDLAKKLGVTKQYVDAFELGRSSLRNSNSMVRKVAEALEIDPAELEAARPPARSSRANSVSKKRTDPLGRFLTERRIALNLNQTMLSQCTGMNLSVVSRVERFGTHDFDTVQKFATALDCEVPPDLIPPCNGQNGHTIRFEEALARWEAEATGEGQKHLDESIYEIELSVRAVNCLSRAGILTIKVIRRSTPKELLAIRHFGTKTLREIEESLGDRKLSLKPELGTS